GLAGDGDDRASDALGQSEAKVVDELAGALSGGRPWLRDAISGRPRGRASTARRRARAPWLRDLKRSRTSARAFVGRRAGLARGSGRAWSAGSRKIPREGLCPGQRRGGWPQHTIPSGAASTKSLRTLWGAPNLPERPRGTLEVFPTGRDRGDFPHPDRAAWWGSLSGTLRELWG